MDINEELINEAEMKRNGANNHAINKAVCNYKCYVKVANGTAWWVDSSKNTDLKIRESGEKKAKLWEKYLSELVATGFVPKSEPPSW